MQWLNGTRFPGAAFVDTDRHGTETLVVLVKATYTLAHEAELAPAPRQRKPLFTDIYAGEPGASSLLYESDANWGRQGTDVAFVSHAWPRRPGEREALVGLRVGTMMRSVRVTGDRHWTVRMGSATPSAPQAFERIPLIYERAFGGVDDSAPDARDHEAEPRNPVGCGLRSRRSQRPLEGTPLPNIELPDQAMQDPCDRLAPCGFTFVPRAWPQRRQYAGTYDENWQASRMPLLPLDFDPRHFRAASEGLHAQPPLQGGEPVDLIGMTPAGRLRFALPRLPLQAAFGVDARITELEPRMSSVVIDTVRMELVVCWHAAHAVHGMVDAIGWVLAQHDALEVEEAGAARPPAGARPLSGGSAVHEATSAGAP